MKYLNPNQVATQIDEGRGTHLIDILQQLDTVPGLEKMVRGSALGDGVVGLFRAPDGNAYEIVIRAAEHAKYINTK
jgi:hypothetical protein